MVAQVATIANTGNQARNRRPRDTPTRRTSQSAGKNTAGPAKHNKAMAVLFPENATRLKPKIDPNSTVRQVLRRNAPIVTSATAGPTRPAYPAYRSGRQAESQGNDPSSPAMMQAASTAATTSMMRLPRYDQSAMASCVNIASARKAKIPSPVSGVPSQLRPGKLWAAETSAFQARNPNRIATWRRRTSRPIECPVMSSASRQAVAAAPAANKPAVTGSALNQTPYAKGGVANTKTKSDRTNTAVLATRAQTGINRPVSAALGVKFCVGIPSGDPVSPLRLARDRRDRQGD